MISLLRRWIYVGLMTYPLPGILSTSQEVAVARLATERHLCSKYSRSRTTTRTEKGEKWETQISRPDSENFFRIRADWLFRSGEVISERKNNRIPRLASTGSRGIFTCKNYLPSLSLSKAMLKMLFKVLATSALLIKMLENFLPKMLILTLSL